MKNKENMSIWLGVIIVVSVLVVAIPGIASEVSSTTTSSNTTTLNITMANIPSSNITVTEEPRSEIEELQQWIYDQGYNFTVAENWITALSPAERQSLCGYKPLTPPAEPLPENADFRSAITGGVGQPPTGQPPAAYDAMALGYVTPVRNQGSCGSCWIFAATTDFESDVLINNASVNNLSLNYSEQEVGDCNIWSQAGGYNFCNGGNAYMTTNYFTKKGASDEACHPYNATNETCQNCSILKNVDNWRIITDNSGSDLGLVNTIKNAILRYGPVYTTINASDPAFQAYDSGIYSGNYPEPTNHAIQIIGWNDTLNAWLIKNSWGTGWGAGGPYPGCAWVEYGASNIGDWTSAIAGYKSPGDTIFFHDECGWMGWCLGFPPNTTAYGAVRFTPSQNLTLTAVDFWAVDPNMSYEIRIFDTLNDLGDGNYSFTNQLGNTQTGTTTEPGYYSIPLNTTVRLASGDDFIVQVKFTTTTGYQYPLPYERSASWLPAVATFSNESYCSPDGVKFTKPTNYGDIGIRARLAVSPITPIPFFIYGWVFNTTNQPLLDPNVTVTNTNTSESYKVETNASYNYYQVITSSCNVSAGDVIRFEASDGVNSTNYMVTVTSQNMTDGGLFNINITLTALIAPNIPEHHQQVRGMGKCEPLHGELHRKEHRCR